MHNMSARMMDSIWIDQFPIWSIPSFLHTHIVHSTIFACITGGCIAGLIENNCIYILNLQVVCTLMHYTLLFLHFLGHLTCHRESVATQWVNEPRGKKHSSKEMGVTIWYSTVLGKLNFEKQAFHIRARIERECLRARFLSGNSWKLIIAYKTSINKFNYKTYE